MDSPSVCCKCIPIGLTLLKRSIHHSHQTTGATKQKEKVEKVSKAQQLHNAPNSCTSMRYVIQLIFPLAGP